MESTTRFHLVRHGTHDLLGHVLAGRMPGVSLSGTGRGEAETLATRFVALPIAAVISSPRPRALETAAPIAARLGLDILHETDLDEIDFGDWTGMSFETLRPLSEWQEFNRCRGLARVPSGETMLEAQARAMRAMMRLRRSWPGAELVVVSHGDVIKSILAYVVGSPLELMRRIEISPASRSVLVIGDEDARMEAVNLPP